MPTIIDYDYILYGKVRPAFDEDNACVGFVGVFYNIAGEETEIEFPIEDYPSIQAVLSHLSTKDWDTYGISSCVDYDTHHIKRYLFKESELPEELEL